MGQAPWRALRLAPSARHLAPSALGPVRVALRSAPADRN
jgi:hypothetical protein